MSDTIECLGMCEHDYEADICHGCGRRLFDEPAAPASPPVAGESVASSEASPPVSGFVPVTFVPAAR